MKVKCPACHSEGETCPECGGYGKFHAQGDYFDEAVASLLDANDEEPIGMLMRFMRGANNAHQSVDEGTSR